MSARRRSSGTHQVPITEVGPRFGSKLNPQRRSSFGLTDMCLISSEEQEEKAGKRPRLHGGRGHASPPTAPPNLLLMRWRVKGI